MQRRFAAFAALPLLLATPALAADGWGIEHEELVTLDGTVVDLLCTLKGDCAPDCGGGKRQLGLLTGDGKLLAAAKGNVFFAGAAVDLAPLCGQTITVDGLLIANPAMSLLFIQNLKTAADAELKPADGFITEWTAKNGAADEWFRADPQVKATIEANGVLGIPGLAVAP